jgi:hypothetical protein
MPRQTADATGRYSNFFKVGYNAFEVLLDFGQSYMDGDGESVHTRIVTSPAYAKALSELLIESLRYYEANYGQIPQAPEEVRAKKAQKDEDSAL